MKFGARKDAKDVETSSKSSGINLSVRIKSQALDRAKQGVDSFKQMQSGDILGGIATSTNTVTGLVQGLSSNITKKDGSKATLKDIKTGELSFQRINSSDQLIFEKTLTPYQANTLIGASSSSQMLVGNGASKVSQVAEPPNYLTKPEQGGTLVIAAENNPIKGAHNIDIKENIKIGVFKGDATNLVDVPTGSQSKVIIENPDGFDPLNPEILRVVKEGGEIEITGIKSNKEFFNIYSGKVEVPKGFEIIEVGEIPENFQKQGFRTDGDLIGQKNGVGTPKKTDKIIRIRKIKK